MITVRTQIKEIIQESGLGVQNMSNDFIQVLDEHVKQIVLKAASRAKENGRRTVMSKDL